LSKILVTGGAGFVGRHLVSDLLESGNEVHVVDSGETGRPELLPSSVSLTDVDISNLTDKDWKEILTGVDFVYHLAARKYNTPGVTAEQLIAANATATYRLAEAASNANVKKFVYSSTLYAYGSMGPKVMVETDVPSPKTVYGASKLFGEHSLQNKDFKLPLNWSVARFFFVYGPGQFSEGGYKSVIVSNFERIAKGDNPVIHGSGEQVLDYIYVGDVVRALKKMADSPLNDTFNLGSGNHYSINEVTKLMLDVSKTSLEPIHSEPDWTEGTSRVGDNRKARELLSWEPLVSLEEGLNLTWKDMNGGIHD
jgi:UDP-glucose 4-epimerase